MPTSRAAHATDNPTMSRRHRAESPTSDVTVQPALRLGAGKKTSQRVVRPYTEPGEEERPPPNWWGRVPSTPLGVFDIASIGQLQVFVANFPIPPDLVVKSQAAEPVALAGCTMRTRKKRKADFLVALREKYQILGRSIYRGL
jgi:hypothetical protein